MGGRRAPVGPGARAAPEHRPGDGLGRYEGGSCSPASGSTTTRTSLGPARVRLVVALAKDAAQAAERGIQALVDDADRLDVVHRPHAEAALRAGGSLKSSILEGPPPLVRPVPRPLPLHPRCKEPPKHAETVRGSELPAPPSASGDSRQREGRPRSTHRCVLSVAQELPQDRQIGLSWVEVLQAVGDSRRADRLDVGDDHRSNRS